jgi:phosphatidate cytidylyltransferase
MNHIVKRTVSALSTASLVVGLLLYLPFNVVLPAMIALVVLVHLEFSQMVARKHEIMTWSGVLAGASWLVCAFYSGAVQKTAAVIMLAAFLALWAKTLFGGAQKPLSSLGTTMLGLFYIPFMLTWFIKIPQVHGMTMLLYTVAIIKISDMGGFAFGVAFGKHKMCPKISPGKSWEGMAGSIFASIVISCAFMPLTHFAWWKAIAFGVAAAVVGTLGDLVESRFKRECEVKDSATFMPAGLGGFLDMFDSLVFAPAVLFPFI